MTKLDWLMHSTAHDLGLIINSINIIEKNGENVRTPFTELQIKYLKQIRQSHKDLRDKLDKFYIENNEKFKE